MLRIVELCESCGKEIEPEGPIKTLEDSFVSEQRRSIGICMECFTKRFKVVTRKQSGYGGTVYDLEEKAPPRFGLGSQKFSCLKCAWIAWTELGLTVHMKKRHSSGKPTG
ncbi:MAG: hypothetical protein HXY34_06260 [Candidatus Thorarchaeota archaeon]|nr:hypothetical protein [Candidatus Thorarchaeota archaeon]